LSILEFDFDSTSLHLSVYQCVGRILQMISALHFAQIHFLLIYFDRQT